MYYLWTACLHSVSGVFLEPRCKQVNHDYLEVILLPVLLLHHSELIYLIVNMQQQIILHNTDLSPYLDSFAHTSSSHSIISPFVLPSYWHLYFHNDCIMPHLLFNYMVSAFTL